MSKLQYLYQNYELNVQLAGLCLSYKCQNYRFMSKLHSLKKKKYFKKLFRLEIRRHYNTLYAKGMFLIDA